MRTKLRNSEDVFLVTHHHWLIMARPLLCVIFMALSTYLMYSLAEEMNTMFYVWVSLAGFTVSSLYTLYRWYERSINIWAVTNYRVIEENGVFSILAKESPLDKINNISYQQSFMGRIFGYGDVEIQTAAGEGMTIHKFINDPKELKDTINDAKDRFLTSRTSTTNFNNSSNNYKAVEEAQTAVTSNSTDAEVAEIAVNLYQKTEMGIAEIAAMVNRDKNFVIEILMDRRILDKGKKDLKNPGTDS